LPHREAAVPELLREDSAFADLAPRHARHVQPHDADVAHALFLARSSLRARYVLRYRRASPGRGHSNDTSVPPIESVANAVLRSRPPKQTLVTIMSGSLY